MKRASLILVFLLRSTLSMAHSTTEVKVIDLETCVIDQPFDKSRISLVNAFGNSGFKWYIAKYDHYFQSVTKRLMIFTPEFGDIYEKEVTVTNNHLSNFESIAKHFETDTANNFSTQQARLTSEIERYLKGRLHLQCKTQ